MSLTQSRKISHPHHPPVHTRVPGQHAPQCLPHAPGGPCTPRPSRPVPSQVPSVRPRWAALPGAAPVPRGRGHLPPPGTGRGGISSSPAPAPRPRLFTGRQPVPPVPQEAIGRWAVTSSWEVVYSPGGELRFRAVRGGHGRERRRVGPVGPVPQFPLCLSFPCASVSPVAAADVAAGPGVKELGGGPTQPPLGTRVGRGCPVRTGPPGMG